MTIAIIAVGRLREAHFRDAAAEYAKRLRRFNAVEIIEIDDLPEPKNASPADIRRVVDAEGRAILAQIKPRDHAIALCIEAKQPDSPALAEWVRHLEDGGAARVAFILGGSNGLSDAVLARANERLSLSPMTFPHQLARVMLLEQLYRARKMLAGETYHK